MSTIGDARNNTLVSTSGNDNFQGFEGLDAVVFNGSLLYNQGGGTLLGYSLTVNKNVVTLSDTNSTDGSDGTDILNGIEKLNFLGDNRQITLSQEVLANTTTKDKQIETTIVSLSDDGFLNFWEGPDGYFFRRFDANGDSVQPDQLVLEGVTTGVKPAVFDDGSFVLVWTAMEGNATTGVFVQLFDAKGHATSQQFKANDTLTDGQSQPVVAITSDGNFVVAWTSSNQGDSLQSNYQMGQTPNQAGVYFQRFDSKGNPLGWETKVNIIGGGGADPFITTNKTDGGFVVGYDGFSGGELVILANPYDKDGNFVGQTDEKGNFVSGLSGPSWLVNMLDEPLTSRLIDNTQIKQNIVYRGPGEWYLVTTHRGQATSTTVMIGGVPVTTTTTTPETYTEEKLDNAQVLEGWFRAFANTLRGDPKLPTATTLNDGTIAIVWQAPQDFYPTVSKIYDEKLQGFPVTAVSQDSSIFLRLYDASYQALSSEETKVNSFTITDFLSPYFPQTYTQSQPAIAALADGGFVVVWQSMLQDASYWGIYAQRFDKTGTKVGDEFQVHTKTQDSQQQPSVTGLSDGGFIISWEGEYQDGNQQGVFQEGTKSTEIVMQRYDKDGNQLGRAFAGSAQDDRIEVGGADSIEIDGADGNDTLVSGTGNDTIRGGLGNDTLTGGRGNDVLIGGEGIDTVILTGNKLDYTFSKIGNGYKITGVQGNGLNDGIDILIDVETIQFADAIVSVGTNIDPGSRIKSKTLISAPGNETLSGDDGFDAAVFHGKSTDYTIAVEDNVVTINSNANGGDGKDTLRSIEKMRFLGDNNQLVLTSEAIANTVASGGQVTPIVVALPVFFTKDATGNDVLDAAGHKIPSPISGGFFNFWFGTDGYYFRTFNAQGEGVGLEKKLSGSINSDSKPAVAVFKDGSFIVSWTESDNVGTGVFAQLFNSDGTPKTGKFHANDTLTDNQSLSAVAITSDGGFVIAWTSNNQGDIINLGAHAGDTPNQAGVFVQRFDGNGNPLGIEKQISLSGASDAFVTATADGGFVVGYEAVNATTNRMEVYVNMYDKDGNYSAAFSEPLNRLNTVINKPNPQEANLLNALRSTPKFPAIAKLQNDDMVVVWQAPRDEYVALDNGVIYDRSIYGRIYNQGGKALGAEFKINTFDTYEQARPAVAALKDGGFIVVWQSVQQDSSYWGIYGQRYHADGTTDGFEFQISSKIHDSQKSPTVTGLEDGGFVVSWEAEYQDGNQQGVFQEGGSATEIIMQRYDKDGNKLGQSFAGTVNNDNLKITGTDSIEIDGAAGDDTLTGGDGNDTLRGGTGNDVMIGGKGNDILVGDGGSDVVQYSNGSATDYKITEDVTTGTYSIKGISGNAINDGTDILIGIQLLLFNDGKTQAINSASEPPSTTPTTSTGGSGGVGIIAESPDNGNPEVVQGSAGNDTLTGGNSRGKADTLLGKDGDDVYIALGQLLNIYDTGGNDTLKVKFNLDMSGLKKSKLTGFDVIENAQLEKDKHAVKLTGNALDNKLIGNDYNNQIDGGNGNDTIIGGLGKDKLIGGFGSDTFIFNTELSKANIDTVTDFTGDLVQLSQNIFKGIDPNDDKVINFISGLGKKQADIDAVAFMVYDTKTGSLYYDGVNAEPVMVAKFTTIGGTVIDANGNTKITLIPADLTVDSFELIA